MPETDTQLKKLLMVIGATVLMVVLVGTAKFYWKQFQGITPAMAPPPEDIAELLERPENILRNPTPFPLKLPPGFIISIFARDVGGARVLALDPAGNLVASLTSQGRVVVLPDKDRNGAADEVVTLMRGLQQPHGLAFGGPGGSRLYVAETEQVAAYDYDTKNLTASRPRKICELPPGGRHFTRSLLFLPGKETRLLISVGSSCDVCVEKDWRYGKVLAADPDGRNLKIFSSGLRNAPFMALHPLTKQVWATEMGRDHLGDELPPDEINILEEGKDYGWPYCYGKQVHDAKFDPSGSKKDFCRQTVPAFIDLPAHSAPLGLAFFQDTWPEEYRRNLLVAYHGSWNRSVPTGYKVVRIKLDPQGKFLGIEDFITGWLTPKNRALGRPVDVLIKPDGVTYISDDKAGVIYRVIYQKPGK